MTRISTGYRPQAICAGVVCAAGVVFAPPDAAGADMATSLPSSVAACAAVSLADRAQPAGARLRCLREALTAGPMPDDNQLDEIERAAFETVDGTGEADAAAIVMLAAAERRSRNPGRSFRRRPDYEVLLAVGDWERASPVSPFFGDPDRTLAAASPVGAFPAGQAVYWQLDTAQHKAVPRAVDLTRGYRVVVYASPSCGYSVQAVHAIVNDGDLRALMQQHSVWVSVPDLNFRWSEFELWNDAAQGMPLHLLRERRHWPMRRFSAVPWFFLLKDGRIVGEHLGWLKDGPERLKALLAPLGDSAAAVSAASRSPQR